MTRWAVVNDDPYWKAPDISVPLLDLHDPCDTSPYWDQPGLCWLDYFVFEIDWIFTCFVWLLIGIYFG